MKNLPVGYNGQRYQAEELGYQKDNEWSIIGWSDTIKSAQTLCDAIKRAPSCKQTRVVDLMPAKGLH